MEIKYMLLIVCSTFIASISQIILKKASGKEHGSFLKEYLNKNVIAGYGLMFAATIVSILGFRGLAYKNGAVLDSFGYLFILILSAVILKEKATKKKLIGNALIIAGVLVFYL